MMIKIAILSLLLTSCGVTTSSNIKVRASDIKYIRDGNRCFAFIASRKAMQLDTSGLGFTYVPCELIGE